MGGRLAAVDGAVVRMRRPLLELRDKLGVVAAAVRAIHAAWRAVLFGWAEGQRGSGGVWAWGRVPGLLGRAWRVQA
jgi:hypothetical protein